MNRRGFLQALGASIAAIVAAPVIGFDSLPFLAPSEPWVAPANPLQWMTLRMAQHIAKQVGRLELVPGDMIGSPGLTHQYNVGVQLLKPLTAEKDYEQRYILPAATALAQKMKHDGITTVAKLPIPEAVGRVESVWSKELGMALRGMEYYEPGWDTHMLRFDVLCG